MNSRGFSAACLVLLIVRLATAVAVQRVNAALLQEPARMPLHPDQPIADKLLVLGVLITGFLGLPAIAALDAFRWHLLPKPGTPISAIGLVLFTLGWWIKAIALRTNAFATSVVRLQGERHHTVVDTGVYGIVRHPFYAGTPLVMVGIGLWLESYAAVLCAIVPIGLVVARIAIEERFLRRELPGYVEYSARVPHRLLPGIW